MYLTVKASCTKQSLVKYIHTVGRSQNDDTTIGAKTIHFSKQLVQSTLTLIVAAKGSLARTGAAYGINLIDKHDARGFFLCLTEQVAYT